MVSNYTDYEDDQAIVTEFNTEIIQKRSIN